MGLEGSHWNRLLHSGNEERHEIWKTKFLEHLWSLGLKDAILGVNLTGDGDDDKRVKKPMQYLYSS